MTRQELLSQLSKIILDTPCEHPLRVAIDGVDGSGKTYLADELATVLRPSNRQIIRASIDGFHNPRAVRYQRGRESPEGYYLDSFNNQVLIEKLLRPLGPGGDRHYTTTVFDHKKDSPVAPRPKLAKPDAVLIMDGVFLQRPELTDYWDIKIFVDVDFNITVSRAVERDTATGGDMTATKAMYEKRYVPGQKMCFAESIPKQNADIVIDNNDFPNPIISSSC